MAFFRWTGVDLVVKNNQNHRLNCPFIYKTWREPVLSHPWLRTEITDIILWIGLLTSLLMTFINIISLWYENRDKLSGHMPIWADKLPISHNNVVGENTVLQLKILETGVPIGDEFWTTPMRTPDSKMFRWRTYNFPQPACVCTV